MFVPTQTRLTARNNEVHVEHNKFEQLPRTESKMVIGIPADANLSRLMFFSDESDNFVRIVRTDPLMIGVGTLPVAVRVRPAARAAESIIVTGTLVDMREDMVTLTTDQDRFVRIRTTDILSIEGKSEDAAQMAHSSRPDGWGLQFTDEPRPFGYTIDNVQISVVHDLIVTFDRNLQHRLYLSRWAQIDCNCQLPGVTVVIVETQQPAVVETEVREIPSFSAAPPMATRSHAIQPKTDVVSDAFSDEYEIQSDKEVALMRGKNRIPLGRPDVHSVSVRYVANLKGYQRQSRTVCPPTRISWSMDEFAFSGMVNVKLYDSPIQSVYLDAWKHVGKYWIDLLGGKVVVFRQVHAERPHQGRTELIIRIEVYNRGRIDATVDVQEQFHADEPNSPTFDEQTQVYRYATGSSEQEMRMAAEEMRYVEDPSLLLPGAGAAWIHTDGIEWKPSVDPKTDINIPHMWEVSDLVIPPGSGCMLLYKTTEV